MDTPASLSMSPDRPMDQNTPSNGGRRNVDSSYIYFIQKGDKSLKSQCVHCGLIRVKNPTRQRDHLKICPKLVSNTSITNTNIRSPRDNNGSSFSDAPSSLNSRANLDRSESTQAKQLFSHPSETHPGPPQFVDQRSDFILFNTPLANSKGYPSSLRVPNLEAARSHGDLQSHLMPWLPSGANHPLSTLYQPPVLAADNLSLPLDAPSNTSLWQPSWMIHHHQIPTDDFPQPSQNLQSIKVEPELSQQSAYPPLEPLYDPKSQTVSDSVTNVEIEDDDSIMDQSSSSGSSTETDGSSDNGSANDTGSDLNDLLSEDDERFPFNDEDDEENNNNHEDSNDDTDLDIRAKVTSNSHIEGRFGPEAIHKRRRKKGLRRHRGPRKPADPGKEFTDLQNEAMRVFIDEQDNPKAMRLIQQAISINPEVYSAHALLSEIYFAEGQDQLAINSLYLGAHAAPRDADIWQGVADACLRLATIDRETALKQALNCYRRILEVDENNLDALFQRAAIYSEIGNVGRALREYDSLLDKLPHNTSVVRQKARLLMQLDQVDEALELCEASIRHGKGIGCGADDEFSWPDIVVYTDIFVHRGQVGEALVRLKRLARWLVGREAEEYWDEITEDDREWDAEDQPRRIEIEGFSPGGFPLESFGQALPLEVRAKLGLYRLQQGPDHRMEALGHFEWLEPDDLSEGAIVDSHRELFLSVAKALKDAKEHQEALRFYEALMATDGYSDSSFWCQIAATSFICGKKEQSRACYEAAKDIDDDCVEARIQLGMLYVEFGDKAKAIQNAQEAVEMTTRGIQKSDRRIYEKKDQKFARKAAERVLKIARRLGRSRARPPRAPSTAQLRRKQNAIVRKEAKLAAKIEKQKTIYERRVGKGKFPAQSDESRTSKIQMLFSHLKAATPTMRSGDSQASASWLGFAQEMIEDFCSATALFPQEKHMTFEGYGPEDIRKSQSRLYEKLESMESFGDDNQEETSAAGGESTIPTDYRGVPFTSWLDIFLETALLHAKSGRPWKEACYALLKSASDCNVWYHDPNAMLQIYTCYFACALELHDEHALLFTVGRWFMKEYQFCTDTYRLFAALNLLYTAPDGGKPTAQQSEFRDSATQKFLLRQMAALDALLPEDYNVNGAEGPVPDFMRRPAARKDNIAGDEDEDNNGSEVQPTVKPKEMDAVLLCLYGHLLYAGDTFVSALSYFYRALTLDRRNPMVLLSIALCYVHECGKRLTEDRHTHVLNGMAVFEEYADARREQARSKGTSMERAEGEIGFNRARLWQMLGLNDLALREYDRVLRLGDMREHEERGSDVAKEWSREAAFAVANIYVSNGDPAMARYITERWLVVE